MHSSHASSVPPSDALDRLRVPADWQRHQDKPGDPNYLGVSEVFGQFAEPM